MDEIAFHVRSVHTVMHRLNLVEPFISRRHAYMYGINRRRPH